MLPEALPYHLKVRDYFKRQTPTWEFFAAAQTREEQLISFQTELLKNTYPFRRETDRALYEKIDLARERLALGDLPVTAYQAQHANPELNASIVYLHQQAHLVFSGPILEKLNEAELLAVIAHELTHIRLYTLLDGDLEVADRIVTAIANNNREASESPYYETARLFKLYTEIYCDRGAYTVLGEISPVISSLLKIATGLSEVNAESGSLENFPRARALRLWHQQQEGSVPAPAKQGLESEDAISLMIEGPPHLDRLDLFSQQELDQLTRLFLNEYLRPKWLQSPLVMALARQYFPNDAIPASTTGQPGESETATANREKLIGALSNAHASIRDYFAYVLLDFALADPSLEEMPVGRAFEFAGEMQLTTVYDPIYKKELQLSDKKWQQHKRKVSEAYATISKD